MGLFGGLFDALGGVARIAGPVLSLNPITAPLGLELTTAGSVAGMLGRGAGPTGGFWPGGMQNGMMDLGMQGYMASQSALFEQQLSFQNAMDWRASIFDQMMNERSETMREQNTIRDIDMEQRKADNQITKKFIMSITE
ncbi:hypothetical protein EPN52_09930 [bacterium]|nr:MAG: hypothetical protein EPN52_09930 [bacterium]